MKNQNNKLSQDVIDHWPEIFKDIKLNAIPLGYLQSVRVQFKNGKVWDINVEKSKEHEHLAAIEKSLTDLFNEYKDSIEHIDFRLDTLKLKEDIQKRTSSFLKKRK